jgi:hypothetical protein
VAGGDPDDAPSDSMMTSIPIGTLHRSGLVCICSIRFIRDNSGAILAAKRSTTHSIFHRLESNYDLMSTMKYLQYQWCQDLNMEYSWVKGHTNRGNEDNRDERLNIKADELYDTIRMKATDPIAAHDNCAL